MIYRVVTFPTTFIVTHNLDFNVTILTVDARIRVINGACAGRRINPMLITPFTEFTVVSVYAADARSVCDS